MPNNFGLCAECTAPAVDDCDGDPRCRDHALQFYEEHLQCTHCGYWCWVTELDENDMCEPCAEGMEEGADVYHRWWDDDD